VDLFFVYKLLGNARNAAFVVPLGGVRGMSGKWVVRFGGRDLYCKKVAEIGSETRAWDTGRCCELTRGA